ncbi:hypothetical protein K461DRAFT_309942 [Myriangium duriaei CBS 260.36]|uniref:Uncharacterized protein n=1 Tax=Myriangium duriaei CBS 260.36 TaxID=1168546 RepID=A0A9P4J9T4_9PEZI|nr:hypothetical protein K461DRAFT_309942 [Myriangium duriaei CBS 260.36]
MASKMTWDVKNDRRLFLTILKCSTVKIDYDAVAVAMSDGTIKLTPLAIRRRMERLIAMNKEASDTAKGVKREATSNSDADGSSVKKRAKKSGGKAAKQEKREIDEEAEDEDHNLTIKAEINERS